MSQDIDSLIRVTLTSNKLEARLRIVKGTPRDTVDEMTVMGIATARGLHNSSQLGEAIARAVAEYNPEAAEDYECVIAQGTPPEHGEAGRFELDESLAEIQQRAAKLKRRRLDTEGEAGPEDDDDGQAASHYDRSTLTIVKPGARVGRIIPQTDGRDGTDVLGGNIAAHVGKPCTVVIDEQSIEKRSNNELYARVGGLLWTSDDKLRITEDLEINGFVDFSTGNVEFDGNIVVQKGVRDCFIVNAGGTITVHELVEAADLIAGKDVQLKRGMTGREKGTIRVGRNLQAKFIDSTEISVSRDLMIEREIAHCNTRVWRDIRSPNAALIGGECTVAGSAELGQVGTESGTPTIIRLGQLRELESLIREATDLLPKIQQRAEDARRELDQLQRNTAKLTASQAESVTELQFLAMDAESKAKPLRDSIGVAVEVVESSTSRSLTVHRRVLPGARIQMGSRVATVKNEIKGPVRIIADDRNEPVVIDQNSGSRTPLSAYATMDIDPTALDLDDVKRDYGLAA